MMVTKSVKHITFEPAFYNMFSCWLANLYFSTGKVSRLVKENNETTNLLKLVSFKHVVISINKLGYLFLNDKFFLYERFCVNKLV